MINAIQKVETGELIHSLQIGKGKRKEKIPLRGNIAGAFATLGTAQNVFFPNSGSFVKAFGWFGGMFSATHGVIEITKGVHKGSLVLAVNGALNLSIGSATLATLSGGIPPLAGFVVTTALFGTKLAMNLVYNARK